MVKQSLPQLPKRSVLTLAVLSVLVPAAAGAQEAAAKKEETRTTTGLEEITVTAERYASSIQETPVAITAISGEALQERQISNVLEAMSEIPSLVMMPNINSSNNARIVMRGAGQENSGIHFDQGVGVYIDDVLQPRVNGAFFDLYDAERFEILRGPQGTLYGRNTSGGALKIYTRKPSFTWTGGLEAAIGNWDTQSFKGMISGPIIDDKLAFSLSGNYLDREGYLYSIPYQEHVGDIEKSTERLKLLYTPTDNLEVQLEAHYIQDYSEATVGVPLQVAANVVCPNCTGSNRDLTVTENLGELGDPFLYNDGGSLNVTYDRDAWQYNFISGYGNLRTFSDGGVGLVLTRAAQLAFENGTTPPAGTNEGRGKVEWFTQEINAAYTSDRLQAVVGLYYYDEEGKSRSKTLDSPTIDFDRGVKAWAAFGQGTYTFDNGLGFTLGLRYTSEDAELLQYYRLIVTAPQHEQKTFTATTPKIGVDWQVNPDLLLYASYTEGFKSGGFNPVPPNLSIGGGEFGRPVPYDPEFVDSYEAGVKFQTEDRSFRVNGAVYFAEYTDMQLPQFFPGTTTSYTTNAASAEITGVELEPSWQPLDSLTLYSSMSWADAKYTKPFNCSLSTTQVVDCSDKHLKAVVPAKYTVGFKYSPELALPGVLTFNGSLAHHSHFYNNLSNELPYHQAREADLYNGSITWVDEQGRYTVALEGRNLADHHYVLNGVQLANPTRASITGYPNPPRTYSLRVGVRF